MRPLRLGGVSVRTFEVSAKRRSQPLLRIRMVMSVSSPKPVSYPPSLRIAVARNIVADPGKMLRKLNEERQIRTSVEFITYSMLVRRGKRVSPAVRMMKFGDTGPPH